MDPVRFGRALGTVTRSAAKGLTAAASAAAAPNPNPAAPNPNAERSGAPSLRSQGGNENPSQPTVSGATSFASFAKGGNVNAPSPAQQIPSAAQTIAQIANTHAQLKSTVHTEGKRALKTGFAPIARAGRALWHEVFGVFFALFAVYFIQGLWMHRAEALLPGRPRVHLAMDLALAVLFTYFTVSSFLRARKISRSS
jgi:hypothetical protein